MKTQILHVLVSLIVLFHLGKETTQAAAAPPVTVDSTSQGPMNGFELYSNGLYWWNHGNLPDEVTPARTGQIAIRALEAGRWLIAKSSRTFFAYQSISLKAPYQTVGRSDDYLFYFASSAVGTRINRRAIFGANAPENDFSGVSYNEVGSILVSGSTVYWNVRGGAAANNGEVRSKAVNGPPGGGDSILGSGMGLVTKMKIVAVVDEDGNFFRNYLFLLNTEGQLWHIRLPTIFSPTLGSPTFYTGNVTDFDARVESRSEITPPFIIRRVYGTRLYATTGVGLGDTRTSGRLFAYNLTSGGTVTEYDSGSINTQLTGVAVDTDRIFVTSTPLRFDGVPGGFGGWVYDRANAQLLRKDSPANSGQIIFPTSFESIAFFQEGGNLRSDTQWLYWTHQNQIRKIRTDAPALQLDYRAVGLEVLQAVQDFNNSVPIVAGKPTLVRGYGQLVQNTTGYSSSRFRLAGRLRAFRGGAQLSGETYAYNNPVIDDIAALATLRADLNRSFQFELPQAWLSQPGPLQLQMTVNATGTAPETGDTPFANNTAIATINVAPARVPCLVFKAMSATTPNYDMFAPNSGFGDIIDRALSLMPVSGFKTYFSSGSVTKPVVTFLGVKQRSFSMPDDANWALIWMTMAHAFSSDPGGCPDTHWVGMFPPDIGTWNGIGGARGVQLSDLIDDAPIDFTFPRTALDNTSCVRMSNGQGNSANQWSSVTGGATLAHELGHNYGRFHIDQTRSPSRCAGQSPKRPWHNFPGDACTLGVTDLNNPAAPIGYDQRTGALVLPNMAGDIMTYANSTWVSPFTWNALLGAIPVHIPPGAGGAGFVAAGELNPQPLPPHGAIYMVQGVINPAAQSVVLLPAIQLPAGTLDPAKVKESLDIAAALPASAPYRLRLLDAGGSVLDERAVVPLASGDGEGGSMAFVQAVPNVAGSVRLQVLNGATVLSEASASPNAPVLTLGSPALDLTAETLALDWTASDADGDTVLFTVQFSPDDGATWETLRVNDPALGLSVSTRLLRGAAACRLRVMATDGFNTTIATTDAFEVPRHGPSIAISGVFDQQRVPFNSNLVVRAFAYDAEDGSLDATAINWTIAGSEPRTGTGATFSLRGLAPGVYTLTAATQDSDGNPGSATLSFEVRPIEVPDGASPVFDGLLADASYAEATEVRLIPGQPTPAARFVHAGGYLYVCFDGLPYSEADATPANINFYINSDGAQTTTPQADDLGFGVDENGVPARSRGNGAGLVAELPLGFEVMTLRAAASWSAEFRIPESALGGWNHDAGIAFYLGYSYCITIPFVGCVSVPFPSVLWPTTADLYNPTTWAPLSLGPLAPVGSRAPVAVATGPGVVSYTDPQFVALNGSGSFDPDGDALSFAWTQTEGPAVSLAGADTATPSFETPGLAATATVRFALVVNDGAESSAPAEVAIVLTPAGLVSPSAGGGVKTSVTINVGDGSATIQLCWPGAPGDLAVIQASEDLVNWENIATNSASFLGVLLHTDLAAGAHPHRFYRAVSATAANQPTTAELDFDGVDDFVEIPHDNALNALPLTITAWIRTSQSAGAFPGIISKYEGGTARGYAIGLEQGRLSCWYYVDGTRYVWDGGAAAGMPFVADGQWHHVAYAVDAAGGRVYLDGSLVSTRAWIGSPGATTTGFPLRFGVYLGGTGLSYSGDLDEVALWSRALTSAEVNQLIPGRLTGSEANVIGYWPLDEGVGESTTDASGHGHDGVLRNGPLWFGSTAPLRANPTAGSALRFDGVDDSVRVAHDDALNAFPLTVTAWVKTAQNSPGYVAIANKYPAGSGNGYSLHVHGGRVAAFYFRGNGTSYIYPGDPGLDGGFIADGRWHHVAFVVDVSGGRIYVDGTQTAGLGWTGSPGGCSTTAPFLFGQYPLGGQTLSLDGRMDEITVWNRALDATEVNGVMSFKPSGSESGLVGYWPFDNGAGTTATDATGHGYDGALQNGPIWVPSDAPIIP